MNQNYGFWFIVGMGPVAFNQRGIRKYLNQLERRRLLPVLQALPDAGRSAFCLTLFYTGCRISEALKMTAERVDLVERALIFETLKRRGPGHFRSVPIPDALCDLLKPMIEEVEPSGPVWTFSRPTGYRLVKDCMAQAGIVGDAASPKGFRHGMAVACLAEKIPITTVQRWMGHARLETTAIYLNVSGAEERDLASRLWRNGPN